MMIEENAQMLYIIMVTFCKSYNNIEGMYVFVERVGNRDIGETEES
jgi:hypothetical protein